MSVPSSELSHSSTAPAPAPDRAPDRDRDRDRRGLDRSYWLARQWAYHSFLPRSAIQGETTPAPPAPPASGGDPGRRGTRPTTLDPAVPDPAVPDPAVRELLAGVGLEPGDVFRYAGRRTPIRPIARRMLLIMTAAGGCPVPIAALSQQLWKRGGPPSHNTLRTTIFRANAAFRGTQCPLHLSVRGAALILRSAASRSEPPCSETHPC